MEVRWEIQRAARAIIFGTVFFFLACDSSGCGSCADGCVPQGCAPETCNVEACVVGPEGCASGCSEGCGDGCGDGCGGCGEGGGAPTIEAYDYPPTAPVVQQAVQLHVTDKLFTYLEENLLSLAGGFLGDSLGDLGSTTIDGNTISICLAKMVTNVDVIGDITICGQGATCDDGAEGCQLDITLQNTQLVPTAPDSLIVRVDAVFDHGIPISTPLIDCTAGVSLGGGLPISARVRFVDSNPADNIPAVATADRTHLLIPSDSLNIPIGDHLDLSISGAGGFGSGLACGALGLGTGIVTGIIDDQLAPVFAAMDAATCTTCDDNYPCPAGSNCQYPEGQEYGICYLDGTETCVPIDLGLEMKVGLGPLLASIAPGVDANLGLMAYLANYGIADDTGPDVGLELAMQMGVVADPTSMCVPYRDPPMNAGNPNNCADGVICPRSLELNDSATTPGGDEYGIGIGIAKAALDTAMWSVYNSGLLCLGVTVDDLPLPAEFASLIPTGISLFLPSVNRLVDSSYQLRVELSPQQAPFFELGDGIIVPGATAEDPPVVEEPLLNLVIPELNLDWYVSTDGRFVRIFTSTVNVEVPLALDVTPDNEIEIVLGDFADLITNVGTSNAELVDPGEAAAFLDGVLGLALPILEDQLAGLQDSLRFALPDLEGIQIRIPSGGFTSLENYTMLGIFADLAIATTTTGLENFDPLHVSVLSTEFEQAEAGAGQRELARAIEAGDSLDIRSMLPRLRVEAHAEGEHFGATDVEYSYRINDGLWRMWRQSSTFVIQDIALMADGAHNIEVRARRAGQPETTTEEYAAFTVVVDRSAPIVEMGRDQLMAVITARDAVADDDDLEMRYRIEAGDWSEWGAVEREIDLSALAGGNALLDVQVRDPEGNVQTRRQSYNLEGFDAETGSRTSNSGPQAGCTSAPSGGTSMGLLMLAGLFFARRRRSGGPGGNGSGAAGSVAVAASALAVFALLFGSGCKDDKTGGSCAEECGVGLECLNETCVPIECTEDSDCGDASLICVDGLCSANMPCDTDDDCEDPDICEGGICVGPECDNDDACPPCELGDAICVGNRCECGEPCPEGCASGSFCCNSSNSCIDLPEACADTDCGPGFELEIEGSVEGNSDTCVISEPTCECVELPPLALRDHGRYLDVAVSPDGQTRVLSAYNKRYTDLMVGIIADDDSIDWMFVDGVPADAPITNSVDGPRGGVSQGGENVGLYTSVAIGADGTIHAAYFAVNTEEPNSLRYARGTETDGDYSWEIVTVDAADYAGIYTDIELDNDGNPTIIYMAARIYDEGNASWHSDLRMAHASSPTPAAASDFTVSIVDSGEIDLGCAGVCADGSCRLDTNSCAAAGSGCDPGCSETQACFDNGDGTSSCAETEALPGSFVRLPGLGLFGDLEFFPNGDFGIAYYDEVNGNLLYTTGSLSDPAATTPEVIDGQADDGGNTVDTGDVGRFADLFILADETPMIAYFDASVAGLRVANLSSDEVTLLDDGIRIVGDNVTRARVGLDPGLAEQGDTVYLVYQDATQQDLVEASWSSASGWTVTGTTIAGNEDPYAGAFGFYAGHAISASGRFVATHRIELRTGTFRDVQVIAR